MKEIKITMCGDCPAHFYLGQYPPSGHCALMVEKFVPFDRENPGASPPAWCPLRKGPVTLRGEMKDAEEGEGDE